VNIKNILERFSIKYKIVRPNEKSSDAYITFTCFDNIVNWQEMKQYLPECNSKWIEYSEIDLSKAEWLTMHSKNMKLNSKNDKTLEFSCLIEKKIDNFTQVGAHHQKQIAPFYFNPVKWSNNNHFYSSYEGGTEIIFCDDYAKRITQEEKLTGIAFDKVMWYRKNIPLPAIHQLNITHMLPNDALILSEKAKETHCPSCGRKKYILDSLFQLKVKKEYMDNMTDFCKTEDLFGSGREHPLLLISQHVYDVFKSFGMIRNLVFEPVIIEKNQ